MTKSSHESESNPDRRDFLKTVAASVGAGAIAPENVRGAGTASRETPTAQTAGRPQAIEFPRVFSGRQLKTIAFPLGGIGAGSISLGGRGQLRDWEIFNRPDKGNSPQYAFPAIWVQRPSQKSVARVLEARMTPSYEGRQLAGWYWALSYQNVPGLPRLESCKFMGEFPLARIDFEDSALPVRVALEAFTPFIPLDPDDSGLPIAILRYRVTNPEASAVKVSIAFSISNPVGEKDPPGVDLTDAMGRVNEFRQGPAINGLLMRNPTLDTGDPLFGTFGLAVLEPGGRLNCWRGWPKARWWQSPQMFWDKFSRDGELGPEADIHNAVGTVCLSRDIAAGSEAFYTFLLSWHFPNRTPARCGWRAPKGDEQTLIGNHYCTRFADAWEAAEYAAAHLPDLEKRTRAFAAAIRSSTLPPAVLDAASANISTLVTPTCFRTADGAFHGFEGCNDHAGSCFGNAVHVWNYEVATDFLFPSFARSLREAAFGYSTDEDGRMAIRQLLPDGKERFEFAAADGQMGQIVKLYLDWRLTGDHEWLRKMWPKAKRALEFAWVSGGWDANCDGVMEGAQHTIDVEFYGPYPLAEAWYLAALCAGEQMAGALGDLAAAEKYHRLYRQGSQWTDAHLFNGEYYIQETKGIPRDQIAKGLLGDMGSLDTEHPEFQLSEGCLIDQLVAQYLAEIADLGPLLDARNMRKTLQSIYRYNYRKDFYHYESVELVFAVNDESGLVMCHYPPGKRPAAPFPYFTCILAGFEFQVAVHMLFQGMISEGVEVIANVRKRYDGERRNPWDQAECGHHYARGMASWAAIQALSGFHYDGVEKTVAARPRIHRDNFRSFWSTPTAWGVLSQRRENQNAHFSLGIAEGSLTVLSVELEWEKKSSSSARLGGKSLEHKLRPTANGVRIALLSAVTIKAGEELVVSS